MQLKIAENKECLFLEATAKQIPGEKRFDWSKEHKIIMKLEPVDIGKIISVLSKRDKNITPSIFHKTEKGSTSLSLVEQDPAAGFGNGYFMTISKNLMTAVP